MKQLKSGFKSTINWKQYESNVKTFAQNRYLSHLVNPSFQGVNIFIEQAKETVFEFSQGTVKVL